MARTKKTEAPIGAKPAAGTPAPADAARLLRATYHLPPALAEKLRDVAWWDRSTVNEVVRTALEEHVRRLEKRRGEAYPPRGGPLRRGKPLA